MLPTIQRRRPIDASGWFWSFVSLLAGLFYSHIWPTIGVFCFLASVVCFFWQFKKWRDDYAINRDATAWCRTHYASLGETRVVEFMIVVAHDTGRNLNTLSPFTAIDDLNWIVEGDDEAAWGTGPLNRNQMWLSFIANDANVPKADLSEFSGDTLHDVIIFVFTPKAVPAQDKT